jgi:hypothetical protein
MDENSFFFYQIYVSLHRIDYIESYIMYNKMHVNILRKVSKTKLTPKLFVDGGVSQHDWGQSEKEDRPSSPETS